MPIPTPFHPRTAGLMESHEWRDWSGYLAASLYEPLHDREYYAIRSSAALIDVSPLFKYEIYGPDAERLVNRVITRDAARCKIGQVLYTPWCDDHGKVIDDGTVTRLAPDRFRVTAADPNLAWFQDCAWGMQVEIQEVTSDLAALALQGPNSRKILRHVLKGSDLEKLSYYQATEAHLERIPLYVSRTGYTGDLGYELWIAPEHALSLWDQLVEAGDGYGLTPAGMLALDIARIEAGLVMIQVDYISTRHALIEEQKSSPYEIGLGWTVNLNKANFVGKNALQAEKARGSGWQLVGVEVDWNSLEDIYAQFDLTPRLAGRASRAAVPVFSDVGQIGQMTSHTFSPLLKKYIGLASVKSQHASFGTQVSVEVTVEYTRQKALATLVELPFYNPPRKRAQP
ncbi:MAG TPA: aminomethyltransferase family protein [Anaerolineales bacterium]|nr:aminomethyltransferase family protein [Anaerolineales bacterium]